MQQSHEIDYQILGDDMQMVEVELDPQETVIAEAGAMNYMDSDIQFEAKMGDGSSMNSGFLNKLFKAGGRLISGESLFITHFTNQGAGKKKVAFAAPYPGKIIPVDLSKHNGSIICQKSAFLCAAKGTSLEITFTKKFGAGFFGGEGFILEKLTGDGMAFIHAGGTVIKKTLNKNSLLLDTGCLVAFSEGINYNIRRAGNLKSMFFGGEGLFLAELTGVGDVYIQSLPFSRLASRVIQSAPNMGGRSKGEGGLLNRFLE